MAFAYLGIGSFRWQAPEQLLNKEEQTEAGDLLNLGRLLYYCIMAEDCPVDVDIVRRKLEYIAEAKDLILRLLHADPNFRYNLCI